jgi:hypothetical protein
MGKIFNTENTEKNESTENTKKADGTGFEEVLNLLMAHLSRCVTGGAFDFGFDSSSVSWLRNSFE